RDADWRARRRACRWEYGRLRRSRVRRPWVRVLERLREVPGRISERQFALLALDHWYESEEVWRLAGCAPGPGPLERLAQAAPWYRAHLAAG
ncbi:hypothetical protein ABZ960_42840, partial [Streptomyces pseudovenezuelae]